MKHIPARAAKPTKGRKLIMVDLAGICACIVVACAWYALSLEPLRQARAARNVLSAELQPRLEQVSALERSAQTRQLTLAAVGEQIAQGELQLRNVDQINHRLSDLTSMAASHGLRLEEVKPGTPVTMQWFNTVPIKLSGTGEYTKIGALLHALPTAFPDIAVVGFQVRGEPEAHEKKPRFELSLVWYAAPRTQGTQK